MGVKLSQLKLNRLRKEIHFFEGEEQQTIQIFNPTGKDRDDLLHLFEEASQKEANKDGINSSLMELYIHLMKTLTDIEIENDDEVFEIISSPNNALILTQHEMHEILNEIQIEYWMTKHAELNQAYQALMVQEAINKADHMKILSQDLESGIEADVK